MDLAIKIIFLVVFFAVMIGIGLVTRKKANSEMQDPGLRHSVTEHPISPL